MCDNLQDNNKEYKILGSEKKSQLRDLKLINKIIIHCSDSDRPEHDDIEVIRAWHKSRGFLDVGYHFFIKSDGTIQEGRPINWIGAHCVTENLYAIGICLAGSKNFTETEFKSCYNLCLIMMDRFKIKKNMVFPHNHFNAYKTCPNFELDKIWQFSNNY